MNVTVGSTYDIGIFVTDGWGVVVILLLELMKGIGLDLFLKVDNIFFFSYFECGQQFHSFEIFTFIITPLSNKYVGV